MSGGKPLTPIKSGYFSVDGLAVAKNGKVDGPAAEGRLPPAQRELHRRQRRVLPPRQFHREGPRADPPARQARRALRQPHGRAGVRARVRSRDQLPPRGLRLLTGEAVLTESQADCAAGAWVASALKKQAPHFRDVTPATVDAALEGFLDGRDSTPGTMERDLARQRLRPALRACRRASRTASRTASARTTRSCASLQRPARG